MKKFHHAALAIAMSVLGWLSWQYVHNDTLIGGDSGLENQLNSRLEFDKKPNTQLVFTPSNVDENTSHNVNNKVNKTQKAVNRDLPTTAPSQKPYSASPMPTESLKPTLLWRRWQLMLENSDYQQLPIISAALSRALQQQYDAKIYDEIAGLLWQSDIPVDNRALILDLLSEIATPEALSQLLTLTEQGVESDLYLQVLQAIARIADYHWQGRYHYELSPVLLTAWTGSSQQDPAFYDAIGTALAGVGDPDAVNNLLLSVSGNNTGENDRVEPIKHIKQQTAFKVIPKITNPQAVAVLGAWLAREPIGAPAFEVSGTALAEIGTRQALRAILAWAKFAPAQGARNLKEWLALIDDTDSMLTIAGRGKQTFLSPEVKSVYDQFSVTATSGVSSMDPGTADKSMGITGIQKNQVLP